MLYIYTIIDFICWRDYLIPLLCRFCRTTDLNTLAKHERQRNSIYSDSSTMTTPSSNPPSNDGIDNDDHYHHNGKI